MSSHVLMTINGKYLKVMDYGDRLMLSVVDQQGEQTGGHTVHVTYHQGNLITFTVSITKDSVTINYILQASGSSLELVPLNQLDQVDGFPEASWFEKDGYSDHYKVRTKRTPQKYICMEEKNKNKRRERFFLSDNVNDPRALVRDKAN